MAGRASEELAGILVEWITANARGQRNGDKQCGGPNEVPSFLAQPRVASLLGGVGLHDPSAAEGHRMLVAAAVAAAGLVAQRWTEDGSAPRDAIAGAEQWLACPCDEHAATGVAELGESVREIWRPGRSIELNRQGWILRIAWWTSMAPRYGWPVFAAIASACELEGVSAVQAAIASRLAVTTRGQA